MKITKKDIPIRDVAAGYEDKSQEGQSVTGYGGLLDIRPAYQREFVYGDKEREAVITTVSQKFPLNTMYWSVNQDGSSYELLDGQQRTVSICQYVHDVFSIKFGENWMSFKNLPADQQDQILSYELSVYICEGTPSEKLKWFTTINIAGKVHTKQELLNAVHTGPWLTDAKRHFSRTGGAAYDIGQKYLTGVPIRQDYLERALDWISSRDGVNVKKSERIERYMDAHQREANAEELWQYFQEVIKWVKQVFPKYNKNMKGLEWGSLYNEYKDKPFNVGELERRGDELIEDDEVDNKRGIYEYLLSGNTSTLNLRLFSDKIKTKKYNEQKGICPTCGKYFAENEMQADHIIPWNKGGKTNYENCQMLCRKDNQDKSGK